MVSRSPSRGNDGTPEPSKPPSEQQHSLAETSAKASSFWAPTVEDFKALSEKGMRDLTVLTFIRAVDFELALKAKAPLDSNTKASISVLIDEIETRPDTFEAIRERVSSRICTLLADISEKCEQAGLPRSLAFDGLRNDLAMMRESPSDDLALHLLWPTGHPARLLEPTNETHGIAIFATIDSLNKIAHRLTGLFPEVDFKLPQSLVKKFDGSVVQAVANLLVGISKSYYGAGGTGELKIADCSSFDANRGTPMEHSIVWCTVEIDSIEAKVAEYGQPDPADLLSAVSRTINRSSRELLDESIGVNTSQYSIASNSQVKTARTILQIEPAHLASFIHFAAELLKEADKRSALPLSPSLRITRHCLLNSHKFWQSVVEHEKERGFQAKLLSDVVGIRITSEGLDITELLAAIRRYKDHAHLSKPLTEALAGRNTANDSISVEHLFRDRALW